MKKRGCGTVGRAVRPSRAPRLGARRAAPGSAAGGRRSTRSTRRCVPSDSAWRRRWVGSLLLLVRVLEPLQADDAAAGSRRERERGHGSDAVPRAASAEFRCADWRASGIHLIRHRPDRLAAAGPRCDFSARLDGALPAAEHPRWMIPTSHVSDRFPSRDMHTRPLVFRVRALTRLTRSASGPWGGGSRGLSDADAW